MVLSVLMPLSFYPHEMSNFHRYGIFIPISFMQNGMFAIYLLVLFNSLLRWLDSLKLCFRFILPVAQSNMEGLSNLAAQIYKTLWFNLLLCLIIVQMKNAIFTYFTTCLLMEPQIFCLVAKNMKLLLRAMQTSCQCHPDLCGEQTRVTLWLVRADHVTRTLASDWLRSRGEESVRTCDGELTTETRGLSPMCDSHCALYL